MSLSFNGQNIFLTFNDPEDKLVGNMIVLSELIEQLTNYEPDYGVCGKETAPSTGMIHYHAFIHLKKRLQSRKFEQFVTVQGVRPQVEKVHNNISNIIKYCKKGGDFSESGKDIWTRKKKPDSKEKAELMLKGNLEDLFLEGTLGAVDVIRAQKLKSIFQLAKPMEKYRKKLILWFKGETGEGKTRKAVEIAEKFNLSCWMSNDSLKWFDGYNEQELAIIDDFRKSMLGDWNYLLRLLDGYGLAVQVKGGFVTWKPKIIIITSPATPHEAFSWVNKEGEEQGWDKEEQLIRRLTHDDEEQIWNFPLWANDEIKLENTIRKFLGLTIPSEAVADYMEEEFSTIEAED